MSCIELEKCTGTSTHIVPPSKTLSVTQNGNYDVSQYDTATVNVGGGGGDFSIAEVTFKNTLGDGNRIYYTIMAPDIQGDAIRCIEQFVDRNQELKIHVPLYKGIAEIAVKNINGLDRGILPVTSGDANIVLGDDGAVLRITGDGTFDGAGVVDNAS